MSQPGTAQPAAHAPVISLGHFPVHEQPEALLEAQIGDVGSGRLIRQGGGHAGQFEGVELVQCGMFQHVRGPSVVVGGATDVVVSVG